MVFWTSRQRRRIAAILTALAFSSPTAGFAGPLLLNRTTEMKTTPRLSTILLDFVCPTKGVHILDCWLGLHPEIANAIAWKISPTGYAVGWAQWDEKHKTDLRETFDHYVAWHQKREAAPSKKIALSEMKWTEQSASVTSMVGQTTAAALQNGGQNYSGFEFPDPIPNGLNLTDDQSPVLKMDESMAWSVFRSYTAFALAAEIHRWLPWSIANYGNQDVRDLFLYYGGIQNFIVNNPSSNSGIIGDGYYINNYDVTPAPPTFLFSFLEDHDLIRPTPLATVGAVLRWMQDFSHILGSSPTAKGAEYIWGYRGPPPMTRIMNGTVLTDPKYQAAFPQTRHWIHMCQGSSNFLVWLLRLVNIPDRTIFLCGHAGAHFSTIGRYLTHGDSPYNSLNRSLPDFPGSELLIDEATFQDWFGDGPNSEESCKNVGRIVEDLALKRLPDALVDDYCDDLAKNKSHADGRVFDNFQDVYTVDELESMDLWTQLGQKAQAEGKCGP